MKELNIEFLEKYKKLDVLCKDMFRVNEGITAYIMEMEKNFSPLRYKVVDWDIVYRQLKYLRRIRNQLSHDVGSLDSDVCSYKDVKWIETFYETLLNRTDPLAELAKIECIKREKQRQNTTNINQVQNERIVYQTQNNVNSEKRVSLWAKLKKMIKDMFLG